MKCRRVAQASFLRPGLLVMTKPYFYDALRHIFRQRSFLG
jgi:hypothetical protein